MKIFDGVTVNPNNLSPTLQGLLGVAMMFAGTLVEADKERQRRAATMKDQATTLEEVMEQSGLDLPKLEEALVKFMGGTPEAKEAASFIAKSPDPVKLLRQFAQQFTAACPPGGPIVTPPPAAATEAPSAVPPPPVATARPQPAQFRPDFTREGMETAANAGPRPRPKLAQFRPEFTREGMDATKTAAPATAAPEPTMAPSFSQAPPTAGTPPGSSPVAASPVSHTPIASPAPASVAPAPASSAARAPTLSDTLARRLAVRDRRIEAHQAELVTRVRCVEAELALLREEVQELQRAKDCPVVFLVPSDEPLPSPTSADMTKPPSSAEPNSTDKITASTEADLAADMASTTVASIETASATADSSATDGLPESSVEAETGDQGQAIELREPPLPAPAPATAAVAANATATTPDEDHSAVRVSEDGGAPPLTTADEEPLPPPASEADLVQTAMSMLLAMVHRPSDHELACDEPPEELDLAFHPLDVLDLLQVVVLGPLGEAVEHLDRLHEVGFGDRGR